MQTPSPFPSQTAWSVVLTARDKNSPESRSRFEMLVQTYWKPVWWFLIRRYSCSREDASDLAQEFFARLYEEDFLKDASPERGKFRTFLKLKLRDLVIDDLRRRKAQKRGGEAHFVALGLGEEGVADPRWPGLTPEEEFDRVWAKCLFAAAVKELEEKLKARGKELVFRAFHTCVLATPPKTYRQCAEDLGIKETDVNNYLFAARGELRQILLRLVRESVEHEGDVDKELNALLTLFEQ